MYPKLIVKLDLKLDKAVCVKFIDKETAGVDFGKGIVRIHPELSTVNEASEKQAGEIIGEYFDAYYKKHKGEMLEAVKNAQASWDEVSEKFYRACDKYFDVHMWPEGKYEAYLSIVNCNPRFLSNKTFQVYMNNKRGFVYTAIHEMLHFLFFDVVEKIFPDINMKDSEVWKISEVFNGIIMREPEFVELTKQKDPGQYPKLIKLQEELSMVWEKDKRVNEFIKSTVPY